MNAVIYARFSCENQREESIEGQVRECRVFAERKGYSVVKIYADRALSGTRADNRPEFQQMISDSESGGFELVIVWKIDRFSRDKYDSAVYKKRLEKNGVRVVSATEPIDDSPEGKLMESVIEGFAQYYVKDLEIKTSRGMTENALNGKFNGGYVTFGYKIYKDGHFRKDPAAAPIVTDIFKRYAEGETIRHMVDDLTARGVTNNGRKITYHFVNWLLKNRRYLGEYSFRDVKNTEAIPPIVSEELFEKCQQRLSANKHKSASFRKVEEKYLLTGKIFCGHCGRTMSGVSGKGKGGGVYRYYQCVVSKRKRCEKKPVSKDFIENAVLEATMKIFDDKALIRRICDACYELQNKESLLLPTLKKQLRQNKKEIENVMKAIKAGIVTRSTKKELERLEREQELLENQIAVEKIKRPTIEREKIEAWIMRFAKTDLKSAAEKQRLIDIFVNSVHVYDDKLLVLFNYKDGEKCIRPDDISEHEKKSNTQNKCSTLIKSGDPYGNRKRQTAFYIFSYIFSNRMVKPFMKSQSS